jgi:hypothetical protein
MKRILAAIIVFCAFWISCNNEQKPSSSSMSVADTIQAIKVGEIQTVLPQAGNVELIESSCMPCHSLRYIEMQPELSYKAWEKTVDKMITVYGAPVRDSQTRKDIIDYLYAIKGKK